MVQINWTTQSVLDLKDIQFYIAKDSKYYAQKTIAKIRFKTQILKTFPKSGRIIPEIEDENYRELIDGNYRIMYKIVNKNRIDMLSIFHSARDLKTED